MKNEYKKYFKYILEHKKNVFKVCWKNKMYIHAFTHDLSKFLPSEFIPYAKWFYGSRGINLKEIYNEEEKHTEIVFSCESREHLRNKKNFNNAWIKHYKRNKHHWDYWYNQATDTCKDMPYKHIKQMYCDWKAISIKFGDTPQEFYANNYDKIKLSLNSRIDLEFHFLGLIDGPCALSNVTWKDYCDRNGITLKEDLREIGYTIKEGEE